VPPLATPGPPSAVLLPKTGPPAPPAPLSYSPASEPTKTVNLEIAAFTLLTLAGGGGLAAAGMGGALGGSRRGAIAAAAAAKAAETSEPREEREGEKEATEGKLADYELDEAGHDQDAMAAGDRSWTWRAPGFRILDAVSAGLPLRLAGRSPLLARVTTDASYLEAIFGALSMVAPILGAVLAILALRDVGGQALPPSLGLTLALIVLGVLNAEAGLAAVAVFVAGVAVEGNLNSAGAIRTILGLAALWFVIPIVASAARPLRRSPSENLEQRWDRAADFVIASLVGAWAVMEIVNGLPGLAGSQVSVATQANVCAVVVLAALFGRWLAETLAADLYPHRLITVQPEEIPESGPLQRLGASVLRTAVFAFVAYAFVGPVWQLFAGAALYLVPQVLHVFADRFPSSPAVFRILPRGLVRIVLVLMIAKGLKSLAFGITGDPKEIVADGFVLVALPLLLLGLLDVFGREGPRNHLRWHHRIAGVLLVAVGVWFVLAIGT
jgi:hypothetical protein